MLANSLNLRRTSTAVSRSATETIDHAELTDLRAFQRTFDLAYTRTALAELSFAIVILRLFDRQFYWCGLIYTVLAAQLILVAIYRYNLSMNNDNRWADVRLANLNPNGTLHSNPAGPSTETPAGQHDQQPRILRRTFRTAGTVVALATTAGLLGDVRLGYIYTAYRLALKAVTMIATYTIPANHITPAPYSLTMRLRGVGDLEWDDREA